MSEWQRVFTPCIVFFRPIRLIVGDNSDKAIVAIGHVNLSTGIDGQSRWSTESRFSPVAVQVSAAIARERFDERKNVLADHANRISIGNKYSSEAIDSNGSWHDETRARQRPIDQISHVGPGKSGYVTVRFENSQARITRIRDDEFVAPDRDPERRVEFRGLSIRKSALAAGDGRYHAVVDPANAIVISVGDVDARIGSDSQSDRSIKGRG
jgi:hypothetical protein